MSTDTILSVSDQQLTTSSISSLSSGASYTYSPSIYFSSSIANGTYYLFAFADYSGVNISETNKANNFKRLQVTVSSPTIDLRFNSVSLSSTTASAGSSVTGSFVSANIGNTSSSSNYVAYYLSTDSVYSSSTDTYLGYYYVGSQSGGTTLSGSSTLTIPTDKPSGNYYIIFVQDYYAYNTESNEANNTKAKALTVTGLTYSVVPSSGTSSITSCSTKVYDNGGPSSNYVNYSSGSLTIYPSVTGNYVGLTFASLSVESGYDYVRIYDGTSTSATLIGTYTSLPASTIYASNSLGALTVYFYSDGSSNYSGFEATVSCVTSVPKPDLKVSSFTLTSTSVTGGGICIPISNRI